MADYENVDVTSGGLSAGVPLKVTGGGKGALATVQAPTGILMSDKDTAGILSNMQRLAAELESPGHKLLSGLKDMTAWTQYNKGPAFALREEANANDRNTLYSIRQQQAALQAAQLQAQAENNRINQLMQQGTDGTGGAGGTSGGAGGSLPAYVINALKSVNPYDVAAKNAILSNYYKQNVNKSVELQNNPAAFTSKLTFIPEIGRELDLTPIEVRTYQETKQIPERYRKVLGTPTGTANAPSAATGDTNLPLSTRQNNPGNLTDATGKIRTFPTMQEGDAALTEDLGIKLSGQSKAVKDRFGPQVGNFMSPALLAETWAPSTAKGNSVQSTQNYGKAIADALGMVDPTAQIPNTPEALAKAKMAITKFEAGNNYPVSAPAAAPSAAVATAPVKTPTTTTAPAAAAPSAPAAAAPAPVSAAQSGLVLPFPNPMNSKEVDANVKAQEDFRKKNLDVRKGEEVEGMKVMSAIQSKAKDRDQIKYAADTIIEEATRNPKAFAYQQRGTLDPLAIGASIPVVGGAVSDIYAAAAGDSKTRQRVNTAADLLGVENTKDLFGGIGARIGAQLMGVGRSAKGVGTDISAEDNLRRATFIKLGIDKVDEQAAAWKAYKDAGGVNGFDFLQSPENKAIETKYENILKQKFPSEYEKAAQPENDKFEYRINPATGKKQMRKKDNG